MKRLPLYSIVVLVMLFTISNAAFAYVTTDQHSFTADGEVGVFLTDFTFGHENHEVYIPVIAERTQKKTAGILSYEVYNDENEEALGAARGIVFGNVPIENGMYVIPKGIRASFTLLVIFDPSDTDIGKTYRTQVTSLPFSFDGTVRLSLNPSELAHYVTPELMLK